MRHLFSCLAVLASVVGAVDPRSLAASSPADSLVAVHRTFVNPAPIMRVGGLERNIDGTFVEPKVEIAPPLGTDLSIEKAAAECRRIFSKHPDRGKFEEFLKKVSTSTDDRL